MALGDRLIKEKIPRHVAIIMDGNGRWAEQHGHPRIYGHLHGVEAVRSTVEGAGELGIDYLTLYAFSTENWSRPSDEVKGLMSLLVDSINNEVSNLMKNNVRLLTIGDLEMLPEDVRQKLQGAIDQTNGNTGLSLILALSYSSKWEIIKAVKEIAAAVKSESLDIDSIDDKLFSDYLETAEIPDPELLIRTSGEYRLSNFLLWQLAYAEFVFVEKFWPDFRKDDLVNAIDDYQQRERRFGKTSKQIKK